ncbi:MAG: tRNA epoxyqueuosine(34) reductase QueG [Bacteroidetes bacterium]|nr:tRNA epoxyqueuosine(34) reductase QueG [Bacteroidota bacterium]
MDELSLCHYIKYKSHLNRSKQDTDFIKAEAQKNGFDFCGITKAEKLDEDAFRLEKWLNKGFHGNMQYMENYFDLRIDPTRLVPGAKSVITLLKNYYPEIRQNTYAPKISKYAYGNDYHEVIKSLLKNLLDKIKEEVGEIQGRGFVDSAPVLERAWAQKSGLGWIGKNGNLITKQNGSFFFIATLITDVELVYDDPFAKEYCGSCTRCIDACPTEAILPDKVIDGSRCISYFTIELKEMLIPGEMKNKFDNWMFGCDTCQDVCPWNRFSTTSHEPAFKPLPEILNFTTKQWDELTEEQFKKIFRNSPLKRSKFSGIKRNLHFIQP